MQLDLNLTLALVAIALAAVAFIISFLQTLLEYMSSSAERNICSYGAIGPTADQTKWRWNLSSWKLKVLYPILKLEPIDILQLSINHHLQGGIADDALFNKLARDRGYVWSTRNSNEGVHWQCIADEYYLLKDKTEKLRYTYVTAKDLRWKDWFYFQWYSLRHPLRPMPRPRSSWAQIISVFAIRDTRELKIELVDAETAPTSVDTPVQRIKLRHIGDLAFCMGFHTVEFDIDRRTFRALGRYGTIVVHPDNALGNVLRFQGDSFAVRSMVGTSDPEDIRRARDLIYGSMNFGKYLSHRLASPLDAIADAISRNLVSHQYDDLETTILRARGPRPSAGPVWLESLLMKRLMIKLIPKRRRHHMGHPGLSRMPKVTSDFVHPADRSDGEIRTLIERDREDLELFFEDCIGHWQARTGLKVPTVYVASTFASIQSVVCAYPSRSLLYAFIPWIRRRSKLIADKLPGMSVISPALALAMTEGSMSLVRELNTFTMGTGVIKSANATGTYGWGTTDTQEILDRLPPEVRDQMIPDPEKWQTKVALIPDTVKLLKRFEPTRWAANVREGRQTRVQDYEAINCLWLQILIVDVAIQRAIRRAFEFRTTEKASATTTIEPRDPRTASLNCTCTIDDRLFTETWGRSEAAIVQGIVRAWQPKPRNENPDDDPTLLDEDDADDDGPEGTSMYMDALETSLDTFDLAAGIREGAKNEEGERFRVRAELDEDEDLVCGTLADLLELRAVFMVAYLFLHPDSSDIYDSMLREEDVELPIA